jgi:hypothetical protein
MVSKLTKGFITSSDEFEQIFMDGWVNQGSSYQKMASNLSSKFEELKKAKEISRREVSTNPKIIVEDVMVAQNNLYDVNLKPIDD